MKDEKMKRPRLAALAEERGVTLFYAGLESECWGSRCAADGRSGGFSAPRHGSWRESERSALHIEKDNVPWFSLSRRRSDLITHDATLEIEKFWTPTPSCNGPLLQDVV